MYQDFASFRRAIVLSRPGAFYPYGFLLLQLTEALYSDAHSPTAPDDTISTRTVERVPLLPLKALKPKKSPKLILETSRTFRVVNVTDPPASSAVALPSAIVQMNIANSVSPMRPSNLRSPSLVTLRLPQLSPSPAPDSSRPSRIASPSLRVKFASTRSASPSPRATDTTKAAANERRQSQKPLPRLPRGQRQRVSMKPPSFIPLTPEDSDSVVAISEECALDVNASLNPNLPRRAPRFARVSMKPPSFIPLDVNAPIEEVPEVEKPEGRSQALRGKNDKGSALVPVSKRPAKDKENRPVTQTQSISQRVVSRSIPTPFAPSKGPLAPSAHPKTTPAPAATPVRVGQTTTRKVSPSARKAVPPLNAVPIYKKHSIRRKGSSRGQARGGIKRVNAPSASSPQKRHAARKAPSLATTLVVDTREPKTEATVELRQHYMDDDAESGVIYSPVEAVREQVVISESLDLGSVVKADVTISGERPLSGLVSLCPRYSARRYSY